MRHPTLVSPTRTHVRPQNETADSQPTSSYGCCCRCQHDILMSLDSANFWWLIRMPGKLIPLKDTYATVYAKICPSFDLYRSLGEGRRRGWQLESRLWSENGLTKVTIDVVFVERKLLMGGCECVCVGGLCSERRSRASTFVGFLKVG